MNYKETARFGPEAVGSKVAFGPDSDTWATAEDDALHLWRAQKPQRHTPLPSKAFDLAFAPDGLLLAAPHILNDKGELDALPDPLDALPAGKSERYSRPRTMAFTPTGDRLLLVAERRPPRGRGAPGLSGDSHALFVLDSKTRAVQKTLWTGGAADWPRSLATHPRFLAAGSNKVTVWDPQGATELAVLIEDEGLYLLSLAFSASGALLAGGTAGDKVRVWDTETWKLTETHEGHGARVSAVAFDPTSTRLASGDEAGTIKIWGGERPQTLTPGGEVTDLAFSPDGRLLIAAVEGDTPSLVLYLASP